MFHSTVCILEDETSKVNGKTALLYHWDKFVMDERGRCLGALAEEIPVTVDAWHPSLSAEIFRVGETVRLKGKPKQLGRITVLRLCEASLKVGIVYYSAIVRYDGKKHSRLHSLDHLAHC